MGCKHAMCAGAPCWKAGARPESHACLKRLFFNPLVNRKVDIDFGNINIPHHPIAQRIEELLNIDALDVYGLTEICGPGVAMECLMKQGMHVAEDHIIPEIIDPVTENPLPYGAKGELVFTTITKEGMPMLRYRTHDLTRVVCEPCACGRTTMRLSSVIGRRGQMIKFKGTTLYPPALYDVLENIPGVNNYIIEVFTGSLGTDQIVLRIGSTRRDEAFEKEIKDTFRSKVRVAPEVVFEPVEYIAKKQMPQMSRKQIKFVDLREQTK